MGRGHGFPDFLEAVTSGAKTVTALPKGPLVQDQRTSTGHWGLVTMHLTLTLLHVQTHLPAFLLHQCA